MAEYTIGQTTTDGATAGALIRSYRYKNVYHTVAGSGQQKITALSMYSKAVATGAGNIRVAIYSQADGSFIAQGSAEINVNDTEAAKWYSHTSFVNQAGSAITPILTAGDNVWLAETQDSTDVTYYSQSGTLGDTNSTGSEYTGGFPASVWSSSDRSLNLLVSCTHEDYSAGGLSMAVAMHHYKTMRS